jgi:general secretion pathway protein A
MGPSGSGKSLLLEVFAQQLHRSGGQVVQLSLLGLEPEEFLWQLAVSWGLIPTSAASVGSLWRQLTDRLEEYRYQQLKTVVLLDDADQADPRVLTHVTRLTRWNLSPDLWLTMVLAGRPEGIEKLGEHLLDLAELRIDVEPWDEADTQAFLATSLAQAGRKTPLFAEPAVAKLHELSHGIPRRISQLADLSLLAGAGQNLQQIDEAVVESVYQELGSPVG